jgi:hypothetical protein
MKSTSRKALTSVTKIRVTESIFTKICATGTNVFSRYSYANCYEHLTDILVAVTTWQAHGRTDIKILTFYRKNYNSTILWSAFVYHFLYVLKYHTKLQNYSTVQPIYLKWLVGNDIKFSVPTGISHLGCDTVYFYRYITTFQKNLLLPSSPPIRL